MEELDNRRTMRELNNIALFFMCIKNIVIFTDNYIYKL